MKLIHQHFFDNETLEKIRKIKSTNWNTLKTEAIDFESDFIWLDDSPFSSEIDVLASHAVIEKLIKLDLNRPNELKKLIAILKTKM